MNKKINSNPLELEEIFLDNLLRKKEEDSEIKERKIESPLRKKKFLVFFVFGIVLLSVILAATFRLQIVDYQSYKVLAESNKFLNLKIRAERGVIYDRNMTQLVSNQATFNLYAEIAEIAPVKEEILPELAEILETSPVSLEKEIEKGGSEEEVLLHENLSRNQLILLETKVNGFPGLEIKKRIKRDYLPHKSLSHILGYLGKISDNELGEYGRGYSLEDYVGREGLEREYEKILAERKGVLEIERDARGRVISKKLKESPCSGDSLVLTLDLGLQERIEQTLRDILARGEGLAAAAVALDPANGEILASVSLPSFDNNLFSQGISREKLQRLNEDPEKPQLNRVVGGVYPVGSTIKPLVGLAALEEGVIDEKTTFFAPLELCLENKYTKELECFRDWKFHGLTDIKKAIAQSVNPFFYIVGGGYERPPSFDKRLPKYFEGLGVSKITQWLRKFGWGEKTDIDLPGEVEGRVPTPDWKEEYFSKKPLAERIWYRGDTYNLSIGQGYLLISPIQVAVAFSALLDGGKIFKPRLVKKILALDEKCLLEKEKKVESQVLREIEVNPQNLEIIKKGMRMAVTSVSGSAPALSSLPVPVGAKTGTAQTGRKDILHNWITVFGPYEKPSILLTIVIENVKGTRVLAQTAAQEILQWWFSH